jgi:monothiol glutaredoxin
MSLDSALRQRIEALLSAHPVVLFMKGTPDAPRCGFSAKAIGALAAVVDEYQSVDVLADDEIREGIKLYGSWPTIPQLYVRGELVGGSDIMTEMFENGELQALIKNAVQKADA